MRTFASLALPAFMVGCAGGSTAPVTSANQLAFGVEMAQRGLWQEALFRFMQADREMSGDPRVLNNLAVAYEATGDFDRALDTYKRALAAAPDNRELKRNYSRFVEFYQAFKPKVGSDVPTTSALPATPADSSLGAGNAPAVPGWPLDPQPPPPRPSTLDPGDPGDPLDPDPITDPSPDPLP